MSSSRSEAKQRSILREIAHDPRLGDDSSPKLVEDRLGAERLGDDPLLGLFEPVGREVMGGEPKREALGAVEPGAGQREELREPAAQPRQIAAAADIGEHADGRLGHREHVRSVATR